MAVSASEGAAQSDHAGDVQQGALLQGREAAGRLKACAFGGVKDRRDKGQRRSKLVFSPLLCKDGRASGKQNLHEAPGVSVHVGQMHVCARLPLSLSLAHSHHARKWPDLRLSLISLSVTHQHPHAASAAAGGHATSHPCNTDNSDHAMSAQPGLLHMPGRLDVSSGQQGTGCFCSYSRLVTHTAALALAYVMLPDVLGPSIQALALPGCCALAAPLAWRCGTVAATGWKGRRSNAQGLTDDGAETKPQHISDAEQRRLEQQSSGTERLRRRWGNVAAAVQLVTGPAALLRLCAWSLNALCPAVCGSCEALVGLLAVMYDYNGLTRSIRHGKVRPGVAAEEAWHAAHKRAARRVARHLSDLHPSPPLKPLMDLAQAASLLPTTNSHGSRTTPIAHALGALWPHASPNAANYMHDGRLCLSLSLPCWPYGVNHQSTQSESLTEAPAASEAKAGSVSKPTPPVTTAPDVDSVPAQPPSVHGSQQQVPDVEADALAVVTAAHPQCHGHIDSVPVPAAKRISPPPSHSGLPVTEADQLQASSPQHNPSCNGGGSASSRGGDTENHKPLAVSGAETTGAAGADDVQHRDPPARKDNTPDSALEPMSGARGPGGEEGSVSGRAASGTATQSDGQRPGDGGSAEPDVWRLAVRNAQLASGDGQGLMLYGLADHNPPEPPASFTESATLALRAMRLVLVFLPFLTIGVMLLVVSAMCQPSQQQQQSQQLAVGESARRRNGLGCRVALRARMAAWRLLVMGCHGSGAAFIKWGQWSATRTDLFPQDFCEALGSLHQDAPQHSARVTRREVQRAFGMPLEQLFVSFNLKPVASGSIAQVHRGLLSDPDSESGVIEVAVKVRHPGVAEAIARDFRILKPIAGLTSRVRMLRGLSLKETLAQFSHTMTAQTDLRVEAEHLNRAGRDFNASNAMVQIPRVVRGLVTPGVLVESWEAGRSVAHFCRRRTPINTELVALGVDAYLAMLLKHNFVHTDLHPGNILVRMLDHRGRVVDGAHSGLDRMLANAQDMDSPASEPQAARQGSASQGKEGGSPSSRGRLRPQIVLIDYGLAEELTPRVRQHFISFLNCISAGNGTRAAHHLLQWSERQACPNAHAFTRAVEALFKQHCNIHSPGGIDLDLVMKSVLRLACTHELTIDSSYAALAVAVCVLVGFATSLDPGVNLMDAATPCLLAYSLTGRVMGRLFA